MKNYTTTQLVSLAAGSLLRLSVAQAVARRHALEPFKVPGEKEPQVVVVKAVAAVQFKAGETFGYEGELPKALADFVEDPKDAAAREADAQRVREEAEAARIEREAALKDAARAELLSALPEKLRAEVAKALAAPKAAQ